MEIAKYNLLLRRYIFDNEFSFWLEFFSFLKIIENEKEISFPDFLLLSFQFTLLRSVVIYLNE